MTNPIDDANTNTGPADNQPAPAPAEPGAQPPVTDPQLQPEESAPDYKVLYEQLQGQARKWETRAKSNADKAKKWDQTEAANRTEAE